MTELRESVIAFGDNSAIDAFGRLRVANPTNVFDAQLTYDLQPLLFEQITSGSGATITHDATNRGAILAFSSTTTGGESVLQTFEHFRYQPGKSQCINISFNFVEAATDVLKFCGYSDGFNGIEFRNTGAINQMVLLSDTDNGDQTKAQADWNLDTLDGSSDGNNPSGLTLDITKKQIFFIDFQALYTGRVRVGFNIGGVLVYVHAFKHANEVVAPYIQTANLPIRIGMTNTGTATTTVTYTCSTLISEGGTDRTIGFEFAQEGTGTAGNGARAHILSIRPKTTFNSIVNRATVVFIEVDLLNTGTNPVYWELCIGQAISGTTTFNDVNATYSSTEFNTLGTISGSPTIVIDSGYVLSVGSGSNANGVDRMVLTLRYPVTLDAAGAHRTLGTLSLLATGIGGTSAVRASLKFVEVR